MIKKTGVVGTYLVPGMPHVLSPEKNTDYQRLNQAMKNVAEEIKARGAKRIFYYSTQWLSVLGLSFQAAAKIKGQHVDENWHMLSELVYDFSVDIEVVKTLSSAAAAMGYQTSLVDYEHFPIDTATIVADRLINPDSLPVVMMASHVYSDFSKTRELSSCLAKVLDDDDVPTALVGVGLLTTNYHAKMLDFGLDEALDTKADGLCRQLLGVFEQSGLKGGLELVDEIIEQTRTDMGLKHLAFLAGMSGGQKQAANVMAYGNLYGAGAAVVSF